MFVYDGPKLGSACNREDNVCNLTIGMIQRGYGDPNKQSLLAVNRAYIGRYTLKDLAA